jgi:hypothetical protein
VNQTPSKEYILTAKEQRGIYRQENPLERVFPPGVLPFFEHFNRPLTESKTKIDAVCSKLVSQFKDRFPQYMGQPILFEIYIPSNKHVHKIGIIVTESEIQYSYYDDESFLIFEYLFGKDFISTRDNILNEIENLKVHYDKSNVNIIQTSISYIENELYTSLRNMQVNIDSEISSNYLDPKYTINPSFVTHMASRVYFVYKQLELFYSTIENEFTEYNSKFNILESLQTYFELNNKSTVSSIAGMFYKNPHYIAYFTKLYFDNCGISFGRVTCADQNSWQHIGHGRDLCTAIDEVLNILSGTPNIHHSPAKISIDGKRIDMGIDTQRKPDIVLTDIELNTPFPFKIPKQ